MTRSLAISIAALVIAGVALWMWATTDVPRRATLDAEPAAEEPLAPLAPPPAEPLPSEPTAQAPPAAPPDPSEPAAPAAPAPAADPAAPTPAEPEQPEPDGLGPPTAAVGPLAKLKGAYDSDPVDPQARDVEHEIRSLFGNHETPMESLQDVRCRKRACKLELRWLPDKPYAYMGAGMMMAMRINPEIAVESLNAKPDKTRPVRYNLYVARDGFEAPELRQQAEAQ